MSRKTKLVSSSGKKLEASNSMIPIKSGIFILLSVLFGYLHSKHIESLFENDKHFSHLSNLERELSFRTESGLYYYYFKNLVVDMQTRPLNESLIELTQRLIINDERTEHPSSINSLQRFNLYPELFLAFLYRIMNKFGFLSKECWQINRGDDMPPVESCVGIQEPIYFYVNAVFFLHGYSMAFLFALCYLVNNRSVISGIVGCICYFFNHSEATRVMWTPALRESFSFPFHLLQMTILTHFLRSKRPSKAEQSALCLSTLAYLLPWQFAQFSLATQIASLFALYSFGFTTREKFTQILVSQTFALLICTILMLGNQMLVTSLFGSLLFSSWVIILAERLVFTYQHPNSRIQKILFSIFRIFLLLVLTFLSKKFVLESLFSLEDDSHIWEILRSKFDSNFQTFDTLLYCCAKEFDFLEYQTLYKLTATLLLPIAAGVVVFYSFKIVKQYFSEAKDTEDFSAIFYHILQLIAFSLMAFMIMRLKLFWTPQLCVMVSLVAYNSSVSVIDFMFNVFNQDKKEITTIFKVSALVLLVGLMSYQGLENLKQQHKIQGEYSDYSMEMLVNWINRNTKLNESFVGAMPTMANVKLSTNRPIVIHPHYEDVTLRKRVMNIYSHLYGYRSVQELHTILKKELKVSFLILEKHYCLASPPGRPECALSHIVHLNLERTSTQKACVNILEQTSEATKLFLRKFEIRNFVILKVI